MTTRSTRGAPVPRGPKGEVQPRDAVIGQRECRPCEQGHVGPTEVGIGGGSELLRRNACSSSMVMPLRSAYASSAARRPRAMFVRRDSS
jgi:hypothetical protein